MMSNELDIQPYIGVNALHFRMLPNQIQHLIGPPASRNTGFSGELTEYRRANGLLMTYDKKTQELVEIGVSRNVLELKYGDCEIFTLPSMDVLRRLVKLDGNPYESVGFIVLLKLGITLTGFHEEALDQKAVTIFAKGRWDDDLPDMKPFVLI